MTPDKQAFLREQAARIRLGVIRGVAGAHSGHPGGSLSIAELLSVLYFSQMTVDPARPRLAERDRLVLSKGHAAPALYAALALKGFFAPEELDRLRQRGSILQGHPDMHKTPGVDISSGSLGQGLSAACGMALSAKYDAADWRVYAVIGDGECQEGQIWEAAATAAHYHLDNLTAFFDCNGLQIDGPVDRVMGIGSLRGRLEALGWQVLEADGHDVVALDEAINEAKTITGKPAAILCHTTKGKGVSFMENGVQWHGQAPDAAQAEQAVRELEAQLSAKEGC